MLGARCPAGRSVCDCPLPRVDRAGVEALKTDARTLIASLEAQLAVPHRPTSLREAEAQRAFVAATQRDVDALRASLRAWSPELRRAA